MFKTSFALFGLTVVVIGVILALPNATCGTGPNQSEDCSGAHGWVFAGLVVIGVGALSVLLGYDSARVQSGSGGVSVPPASNKEPQIACRGAAEFTRSITSSSAPFAGRSWARRQFDEARASGPVPIGGLSRSQLTRMSPVWFRAANRAGIHLAVGRCWSVSGYPSECPDS